MKRGKGLHGQHAKGLLSGHRRENLTKGGKVKASRMRNQRKGY